MRRGRGERARPEPLDEARLEAFAVSYLGRYATTRAKLAAYLRRKLGERGWAGPGEPPVDVLVERLAGLGYLDDRAFALARAAALGRRGQGAARVEAALRHAGIGEEDRRAALEEEPGTALASALAYARRRRIGPFASGNAPPSPEDRRRNYAALLRAGHRPDIARRVSAATPGEALDEESG